MWSLILAPAWAGTPLSSPVDGWTVTVPDGWRSAAQAGTWVLGSDTEPGLVVLSFTPGLGLDALRQQARQGLTDQGLVLSPLGAPSERAIGAATAVVSDFGGTAGDGTPIRAHGVGIAGTAGALVVLGLTTPEPFPGLAARVDAIAGSATFSAPSAGAVGSLAGTLCAWTGGEAYSSTQRMTFDGKGHVKYGSDFAAGGALKDSLGDTTSTWSAVSQGDTSVGTYAVSGADVVVRFPDGAEKRCTVHFRQPGGQVTELSCAGKLWGSALCQ